MANTTNSQQKTTESVFERRYAEDIGYYQVERNLGRIDPHVQTAYNYFERFGESPPVMTQDYWLDGGVPEVKGDVLMAENFEENPIDVDTLEAILFADTKDLSVDDNDNDAKFWEEFWKEDEVTQKRFRLVTKAEDPHSILGDKNYNASLIANIKVGSRYDDVPEPSQNIMRVSDYYKVDGTPRKVPRKRGFEEVDEVIDLTYIGNDDESGKKMFKAGDIDGITVFKDVGMPGTSLRIA